MAARKPQNKSTSSELMASLKSFALELPGAWPDNPWGDSVVKVGKKIFVFLGDNEEDSMITVKVPESHDHAMSFNGAAPTGYGLGKAGWVTIPVAGLTGDDAEVLPRLHRGELPHHRPEEADQRARRPSARADSDGGG